jgi:hypothetical protein
MAIVNMAVVEIMKIEINDLNDNSPIFDLV